MSLMTSLMYAAAAVALLAVVLECCCRRRLRQARDDLNIAALNGQNMNAVPYPVGAPYPVSAGAPAYPMPAPAAVAVCDDDTDLFFRAYATAPPATQPTHNASETPPPTYEQVMASRPRPG